MSCFDISYRRGRSARADILAHLKSCDGDFSPPLHTYTELGEYSAKIARRAVTFEAWRGDILAGLVAAYLNDPEARAGFITNVSVLKEFERRGIASRLVADALEYARAKGFETVSLEVPVDNAATIRFYRKFGFARMEGGKGGWVRMRAVF
jgi:ribosomal protein S18 acetylase RimI-like enzyme